MSLHAVRIGRRELLTYRARVSHLARRLPPGSYPEAAWGGLQDTVPRAAVIALHARVEGTRPDAWEDAALVQIWFRGGADYVVPRADVGVFTLGSYPRDEEKAQALEALADEIHRLARGRVTPVRDIRPHLDGGPLSIRNASITGRVHIRWDAHDVWVIPVERPTIDTEDARRELARRFLHWYGPATPQRLARWTGVPARDAGATWRSIEPELAPVEIGGTNERRWALAADVEAMLTAEPIDGVRLLPQDDPFTKFDHELLVTDPAQRRASLPKVGQSPGYIPGGCLVDGAIAGAWQRQGRTVTIHTFRRFDAATRAATEHEALMLPIAGPGQPVVRWAPVGAESPSRRL